MSNLLIIGAAGRMGNWFFRYFANSRRHQVQINDNSAKPILLEKIFLVDIERNQYANNFKGDDVIISHKITDFLKATDIILFCTPVKETVKILRKHQSSFKQGIIILEISSIKSPIYKRLSSFSKQRLDATLLCLHPMFGPGALIPSSRNIILHVPVNRNKNQHESKIIKGLFPKYKIIILDTADKHDLLISVMISLIYFMNLIFSIVLIKISNSNEFKLEKGLFSFLKTVSGSSYKIQSMLSESILTDDVNLFLSLFFSNKRSKKVIRNYGKIYNKVLKKLEENDKDYLRELIVNTKDHIQDQIDIYNSYESLYRFLNR